MATMLRDVINFFVMEKELHGFLFLCMNVVPVPIVMMLCLEPFWPPELRYNVLYKT